MRFLIHWRVIAVACLLLFPGFLFGQSLPVGTPVLEDYYRRLQLTGGLDSNLSFSVRPVYPAASAARVHDLYNPLRNERADTVTSLTNPEKKKAYYEILPLLWEQQYNSHHPFGWNDGLMIPAAGYQTLVSTGVYFRYGILSVQLRPEFVYAAQNNFPGYASGHTDQDLKNYYSYYNSIDVPERFGAGQYTKVGWGQSSIRLDWKSLSAGLSNENIWWGPGIRNALIMTNNAPGFEHLTLNTIHPLVTAIGTFEGQVIAGRLNGTDLAPLASAISTSTGEALYQPRRSDWRYITGFNISYQPRWMPGLFLGVNQAIQTYHNDLQGLISYLPLLSIYQHPGYERDQVLSVYSRWLFAKSNAEVYFEYGWNDYSSAFSISPDHSRAYVAGLRKIWPLAGKGKQGILLGAEITQLSQSTDRLDNPAGGWYQHYIIRQGWTNQGQVLGAGIGSGGNLQSVDISWVSGMKKLGIVVERYEHAVDFSLDAFPAINDHSRKWVDLGLGLQGDWDFKHLLLQCKIEPVKSYNYEWILKNYSSGADYIPNNNEFNLHATLAIIYRF